MIKIANMEKFDLFLSTYTQYVEEFRFWMNIASRFHRLPDEEITKIFVSGLKLDIVREEMYSRTFETLDIICEAGKELSIYRDILEISDRIMNNEPKKDFFVGESFSHSYIFSFITSLALKMLLPTYSQWS